MDCDQCPIKQECQEEKERILNETTNEWKNHIWNTIDHCPLIEQMKEELAHRRVITIETCSIGE